MERIESLGDRLPFDKEFLAGSAAQAVLPILIVVDRGICHAMPPCAWLERDG